MPNRRVHSTEGDDGDALELNALLTEIASVRTELIATCVQLDADATVNDTDYAANCTPAVITQNQLARGQASPRRSTELPGALTVPDSLRIYATTEDGAILLEYNAARTDLESIRANIQIATAQLDADTGVTDTDYAANNDVTALTALVVVAGEPLAGSATVNAAGAAVHSSDADDAITDGVEAMAADLTAIRASLVGVQQQLDADGGVTDTDYEANNVPAVQTSVGTRRASTGNVAGLPGLIGPTRAQQPAGDPAL